MTTQYLDFPVELLNELGTNKRLTKEVHFSHRVCNSSSNFLHYCTMYEGKRYKTSQEQKDKASKLYSLNVKQALKQVKNKLVFVGMGMNYSARYEDDVCNHRIRTEITNPEGRKFFIEVGTWGAERLRIDFVIDRDQENFYSEQQEKVRDEIKKRGGFHKVAQSDPLFIELKKYQEQPYYHYKKDEYKDLNIKYTNKNVIELVNSLFGCFFTEMMVDYDHLSTDLYTSVSPKKI